MSRMKVTPYGSDLGYTACVGPFLVEEGFHSAVAGAVLKDGKLWWNWHHDNLPDDGKPEAVAVIMRTVMAALDAQMTTARLTDIVSGDRRLVYDARCSEMVGRIDRMLTAAAKPDSHDPRAVAKEAHDLLHDLAQRLLDNEVVMHVIIPDKRDVHVIDPAALQEAS